MKTSLSAALARQATEGLRRAEIDFARHYPGLGANGSGERQPVHSFYGGAHLFRSDSIPKLGAVALRALEAYAPEPAQLTAALGLPEGLGETLHARVADKLRREPIEDYRIDFEDGYGHRADEEEDGHAVTAGRETAAALQQGTLPPYFGIRIKALTGETRERAVRTLDLYLTTLVEQTGGALPPGFVITLPKAVLPEQMEALAGLCEGLEAALSLPSGALRLEIMVEAPQAVVGPGGELALPRLVAAGRGRCRAAHFGAYDYTAGCDITAAHQTLAHPACDFARQMMQVSLSGTGVWLVDGATTTLPIAPHRAPSSAEQTAENREVVHRAWKLHYDTIRRSLTQGFYQSWDLHPAQLIPRYAAVHAFFLEDLEGQAERLRNFVSQAAQATRVGEVFDDAATGQGLLNSFLRAVHSGALSEEEALEKSGLTLEELRERSFLKILGNRRG